MRLILTFFTMVACALLIGFGLSYFALDDGRFFGAFNQGSWAARPDVGSPTPNPYTRAFLARNGALQLGRGEGVQFLASTDANGDTLDLDCTYLVAGQTPIAAFWTLRIVGNEGRDLSNPDGGIGRFHSSRLARSGDGDAAIYVSKQLSPRNWLEVAPDVEGPFSIALTFYDASFFAGFGSSVAALPVITNEGCE